LPAPFEIPLPKGRFSESLIANRDPVDWIGHEGPEERGCHVGRISSWERANALSAFDEGLHIAFEAIVHADESGRNSWEFRGFGDAEPKEGNQKIIVRRMQYPGAGRP
jgi:hypothetical protein